MRIIEETKRQGASGKPSRRGVKVWGFVALVGIFILLVVGIRLLVAAVS